MPAYARVAEFTALVREAHPGFRLAASSLGALFTVLNDANGQAAQVVQAINAMPAAKRARYRQPLYFLAATYPALNRHLLHWHAPGRANAAMYARIGRPDNYQATHVGFRPLVPESALLGRSLEAYLLNTERVGVLLVHLEGVHDGYETLVEGLPVSSHIASVLRVARAMGCSIRNLTQQSRPLVVPLAAVVQGYVEYEAVNVPEGHMGTRAEAIRTFAAGCDSLVVCGFDAEVCVMANIFGSPEVFEPQPGNLPQGVLTRFLPPLVSICDVVTSRAVVVTSNNVIFPTTNHREYGPLLNV
jgi:hypothetical protein